MRSAPLRLMMATAALGLMALGPSASAPNDPPLPSIHASTIAGQWSGMAPCLSLPVDPEQRLAEELARAARAYGPTDAAVAGFHLIDQPADAVEALRAIVERNPMTAPPEPTCHDVTCAVTHAYGHEVGVRMLLLALAYRKVPVIFAATKSPPWSAADIDEIIGAFDDMPPSLFPLRKDQFRSLILRDRINVDARMKGVVLAMAGRGAPGLILSAEWRKVTAAERRATIAHELAHDFVLLRGDTLDWRSAWETAVKADADAARDRGERPQAVSPYGASSLDEDFAESVAAYRYLSPGLMRRAPNRYRLLRAWMFDELEYGQAAKCGVGQARSRRIHELTLDDVRHTPTAPSILRELAAECGKGAGADQCSARLAYARRYRAVWMGEPASHPAGSAAALEALLAQTPYVERTVAELPATVLAGLTPPRSVAGLETDAIGR